MNQPDFIEVFENALSPEICRQLLAHFERSGQAKPGRVGSGVLPELKDSRDIGISGKPEWREAEAALNAAMFTGLLAYLRKYRYVLLAPLMLQTRDARSGTQRRLTEDDFDTMTDAALSDVVRSVLRPGAITCSAIPPIRAVIRTGIASCIRKTPAPRPCIAPCYGRSISTMASAKARPNFFTSSARSCRGPARC